MIRPGRTTQAFALAFLSYAALTLLLFQDLIGRFSTAVPHDAITADSWTFTNPMPSVPPFVRLPGTVPDFAAVLELPLGNVGPDIAAIYRSIAHGHPVIGKPSGPRQAAAAWRTPRLRVVHRGAESVRFT